MLSSAKANLAMSTSFCLLWWVSVSAQGMEIFVDHASMAFSEILDSTVNKMAEANGLRTPENWPILKTTGHPPYHLPEGLVRRAHDHPKWQVKRIAEYRVASRVVENHGQKQRIVFLYHQQGSVLFVLFLDIPRKEDDPSSPF
jgi:hypothetical protein